MTHPRTTPFSLSDAQLAAVMAGADPLPADKRAAFLQRIAALLKLHAARYPSDDAVTRAIQIASRGLTQREDDW